MQNLSEILDKVIAVAVLPATILGALGALLRCRRNGKTWLQTGHEVLGGAVVANIATPIVADYIPQSWHGAVLFLIGFGGIALVEWAYHLFVGSLEQKVREKFGLPPKGQENAPSDSEGDKE